MPVTVEVLGANRVRYVAAELKREGRGDLRRMLLQQIRAATLPVRQAVRESAAETLPKRGGLAQLIHDEAQVSVRISTSMNTAAVRIRATDKHSIKRMDAGSVRHPVFGRRNVWVTEDVRPGWFTKPIERQLPAVRVAVLRGVDNTARRLNSM